MGDTAHSNAEQEMMKIREKFFPVFVGVIASVMSLIILSFVALIVVIVVKPDAAEAGLFGRLIQITFGMILGASCIFFGVVLSWLGITATYSMGLGGETQRGKGTAILENVGPGIV